MTYLFFHQLPEYSKQQENYHRNFDQEYKDCQKEKSKYWNGSACVPKQTPKPKFQYVKKK